MHYISSCYEFFIMKSIYRLPLKNILQYSLTPVSVFSTIAKATELLI